MRAPRDGMDAHRDRDLERPATGRFRDDSGSILVLAAILMPLMLMVSAVAIDVGYWWVNGKKAQIAADACALAAAGHLPATWDRHECVFGQDYVLVNLPPEDNPDERGTMHLDTHVVSPYKGQSSLVEATVSLRVRTFFGRILGLDWIDLTRRAVAEQQSGQGTMAIYVNSVDCDSGESLEFDGKDMHINGWVHTEGGLHVSVDGSQPPQPNFTADRGTMAFDPAYPGGGVTRCQESINPVNTVADFVPGHPDYLPEGIAPIDWPVWYTPAQFGWYQPAVPGVASPNRCRFKGNKIEIENTTIKVDGNSVAAVPASGLLPTGIYCARETFSINGDKRFNGSITALAEEIKVNPSANGIDLQAYAGTPDAVLFFTVPNSTGWPLGPGGQVDDQQATLACSHTKELVFNGDNSTWSGLVFNPCTRTLINQSNTTGSGAIVTKMLKVNGTGFDFTGDNNFSGITSLALVE